MITIGQAIEILSHPNHYPFVHIAEAQSALVDFSTDMLRMIDGLSKVSFPIPDHLQITLDPNDDTDSVFITMATADRIYRALGSALAAQS